VGYDNDPYHKLVRIFILIRRIDVMQDEKKHLTLAMSSEDEYDSDTYASFLEKMVAHKLQALQSLQKEVAKFKKNLAAEQQSSS